MKKIAVALLALAIVLTTVLVPILADEPAITTVGYSSARIKKANLTDVVNINDYDAANTQWAYKITDAAGLVKLSQLVNGGTSFRFVNLYLAKDIDMAGIENFEPIGRRFFEVSELASDDSTSGNAGGVTKLVWGTEAPFEGNFDGHGHVIKNLKISVSGKEFAYVGLFGYVKNVTIKNLIIDESCSVKQEFYNDYGGAGALIGYATGTNLVENIYNNANVKGDAAHAALVGRGSATYRNCTNTGDMSAMRSASGFTGYLEGPAILENCRNTGTIKAPRAGGLVARAGALITATNCINNGNVYGRSWEEFPGYVGGIVGAIENTAAHSFTNCISYGQVGIADDQNQDFLEKAPVATDSVKCYLPTVDLTASTATFEGTEAKTGTDPTLATDLEEIDFDTVEDTEGTETAFTTRETLMTTQAYEIPDNATPTGTEIGYSSARVEKVDLTNIPNLTAYRDIEVDAYKVTCPEDLYFIDEIIPELDPLAGVVIYFANDIDYGNTEGFLPISYDTDRWVHINDMPSIYFGGIIDGQGYKVVNLKMIETFAGYKLHPATGASNTESIAAAALFGYTAGATFKNIVVDDSCSFKVQSSAANPVAAAFSAKVNGVTVDNCWNQAELSGARFAGSVSGRVVGTFEIKNYTNSGKIEASQCSGGVLGYSEASGKFINSRNVGEVYRGDTGNDTSRGQGGFVARNYNMIEIDGCINNGTISGPENSGAFVGVSHTNYVLKNSYNYGTVLQRDLEKYGEFTGLFRDNATAEAMENSENKFGQIDTSLKLELNLPDTPAATLAPGETTAAPVYTTTADPGATDAAPGATEGTTAAPGAAATTGGAAATTAGATNADGAGDDAADDEGGCNSGCGGSVVGSFAVIALMGGAALTILKKKED